MKLRVSNVWRWQGTIDRGAYALLGAALVLVKYNIDRFIYRLVAGPRHWPIESYWTPGAQFGLLEFVEPAKLLPFVLVALPFLFVGIALTVRRLRSAGLPTALVVLFFVPVLNLLLFLTLAALPEKQAERNGTRREPGVFGRLIPRSRTGSAVLAIILTAPLATLFVWVGTIALGEYGWGLFLGIPFFLGLVSVIVYGYHEPRDFGSCMAVALGAILGVALVLFALALEGVICLLMAAPIGSALSILGGIVGYEIQRNALRGTEGAFGSLVLAVSLALLLEHANERAPTVFAVRTAVEIDAPPAAVWREVVAFSELPPPAELLFRAGIAYPIRAEIEGSGPGAVRHCVFSTGAFVEPIEVWDEPRLLKFSVVEQPPAMKELMLWPGTEPPHVDDYLVSQGGQFLLAPLAGGRTRLEGTTWYSHAIWPERYWKPWSDWIVHTIHRRVLEHIRRRAEDPG